MDVYFFKRNKKKFRYNIWFMLWVSLVVWHTTVVITLCVCVCVCPSPRRKKIQLHFRVSRRHTVCIVPVCVCVRVCQSMSVCARARVCVSVCLIHPVHASHRAQNTNNASSTQKVLSLWHDDPLQQVPVTHPHGNDVRGKHSLPESRRWLQTTKLIPGKYR